MSLAGLVTPTLSLTSKVPPAKKSKASKKAAECGDCDAYGGYVNVKDCRMDLEDGRSFHQFTTEDIEKFNNVSFSDPEYTGKVLLVVNLASFWGYTPQYISLNALTEKYAGKPFKILGFPCNQFLRQEPGANASEIYGVLKYIRPGDGFVPNFEMFAKSDVNGENENPIYTFLKFRCPSVRPEFQASYKLYYSPYHQDDIRWNFEKFLIDHKGQPVWRYDEALDPSEIVPDIDQLLESLENSKEQERIEQERVARTGSY